MSTSLILILCGTASLGLCVALFYKAAPRRGRPASPLVATEARTSLVALSLVSLFCFGLIMLLRGLVGTG